MIVVGSPNVKAKFSQSSPVAKFFTFEELSAESSAGQIRNSFFDDGNDGTITITLYGQNSNIKVGSELTSDTATLNKPIDVFFYQRPRKINHYTTQILSPPISAQKSPSVWTLWSAVILSPRKYSDIVLNITGVDEDGRSPSCNYC